MKRTVRAFVIALLAVVAVVAVGGVAIATPPSGATPTTLGRGTLEAGDKINTHQLKLAIREDVDVVTQTITFVPNGQFGWHSHPGPVFVTIVSGELTYYDSDEDCTSVVYSAGDSFIDEGSGHVHYARNEGTTDLVLYATYLVPVGASLRIDADDPGFCSD
jgi:quercetin dioxygenase-like cupin family protein